VDGLSDYDVFNRLPVYRARNPNPVWRNVITFEVSRVSRRNQREMEALRSLGIGNRSQNEFPIRIR